jgi:hypothetical protein
MLKKGGKEKYICIYIHAKKHDRKNACKEHEEKKKERNKITHIFK